VKKGKGRYRYWSDPAFRAAVRVVFWYAVFGVVWILVSDQAVRILFTTPELITRVSTIKGWFYVAFTALGLFVLLLASIRRLHRSTSEAAAYFSATPAVMQVCADDLKLETINEAGLSLYDRSLEHLQETDWIAQVIAPSEQQALRSLMYHALEEGVPAGSRDTMTIHVVANPSAPRTLLCRVSALADEKGKPVRVLLTGLDVTDQERELEQRSRAEKLESIGLLAGGVAHDFNNFLSGILGQLSLAKIDQDNPNAVQQHIAQAETSALLARDLARQLLTFDRGWQPIRSRCDIRPLIRNAVDLVISGSAIEIEENVSPELADVRADRSQMSQVLMNLLLNAKQAMAGVGHIWITAENREVSEEHPWKTLSSGTYVCVSITNDGPAVDPAVLTRLFEPYFTTKPTGTGLGLATCYAIITKHGGIIETFPGPGNKGVTFRFGIPADVSSPQEHVIPQDATAQQGIPRNSGRILIIDDDAMIRKTTVQLLNHVGYDALAVSDGDSGLAVVREGMVAGEPFAAALLDLTIPGKKSGYDIIAELKQLDPQIVAIASSGSVASLPDGYASRGFDGSLEKPYTMQQLSDLLSRVLWRKETERL
jgi:signal transduction histidine kinase/ActR/RegA family two-component response regulator